MRQVRSATNEPVFAIGGESISWLRERGGD
jgi:hypothetical protein